MAEVDDPIVDMEYQSSALKSEGKCMFILQC